MSKSDSGRALANHAALRLTEGRVRGAIRTLELVGFLDRALASGSAYQPTPDGLRRKPVLYQFGSDYGAARGRRERTQPVTGPAPVLRPSAGFSAARGLKSPKYKSEAEALVLMGKVRRHAPEPPLQKSAVDSALERWTKAFEESRRR